MERRSFLRFLGAAAVTLLVQPVFSQAALDGEAVLELAAPAPLIVDDLAAFIVDDLVAITRRAYLPAIIAHIYEPHPALSILAGEGIRGPIPGWR